MKAQSRVISGLVIVLMTYGFVRLWLGSAVSERFWTWLNARLSGGTDPGLASDVELVIVLAAALGLSAGAWWVFSSTWARRRARHST